MLVGQRGTVKLVQVYSKCIGSRRASKCARASCSPQRHVHGLGQKPPATHIWSGAWRSLSGSFARRRFLEGEFGAKMLED
jgi:hypothetical protein